MEEKQKQETATRRKGQPRKPDIEPLYKKVLRCANVWMALTGILIFLSMLWIWAMHNIHLVVGSMQALTALAAETTDRENAKELAETLLNIRAEAPRQATRDYTADEQMVLLARYRDMEADEAWQDVHTRMQRISYGNAFAGEFSLVCLDATQGQLIWIASAEHSTGYSAWLKDLAIPGEEGYELKSIAGHREGTAVLAPLGIAADGCELYICGAFSFAGIMAQESKKMLVPVVILLAGMAIVSLRLVIIIWKKRMQENVEEEEEDDEENGEDENVNVDKAATETEEKGSEVTETKEKESKETGSEEDSRTAE